MHLLSTVLAAATVVSVAHAKACPPLGPVLLPPVAPSKNAHVKLAVKELAAGLEKQFSSTLNTSGVSIGVKSIHEDEQLFDYHFTPPVLSGIGTDIIDKHTIFRVGSLSKMMPALAAVQSSKIDMSASILKYLPELKKASGPDPLKSPLWEDITVGSLLSHLSGLATDTAQDLAILPTGPWTKMGLPKVPKGTGPDCSGLPGTRPCGPADLLEEMKRVPPDYAPYTTPSYSNIAFALLGMVIEAATGQKFDDVVNENIWKVAGMKSTSFNGPVAAFNKTGFVPVGETTWNLTLGVYEPTGGLFSNTVDLIAFGEAILENRLLSVQRTRQWMKPETHTSSYGMSVGGPWEILRANNITADQRVVDVYSKSGDLGLYHGFIGLVTDYDLVITVVSGGAEVSLDQYATQAIFSTVVKAIVPAVEAAGKDEAASNGYVGTYHDKSTNSSITLKVDDGPGLIIESFSVRGYDVLGNIGSYNLEAVESGLTSTTAPHVEGRMYPSNIGEKRSKHGVTQSSWRALFDATTEAEQAAINRELFNTNGGCDSWFVIDRSSYDFQGLGAFVFVAGEDGVVKTITSPAFNVTLTKVSSSNGTGSGNGGKHSGKGGTGGSHPAGAASSLSAYRASSVVCGALLIAMFFF